MHRGRAVLRTVLPWTVVIISAVVVIVSLYQRSTQLHQVCSTEHCTSLQAGDTRINSCIVRHFCSSWDFSVPRLLFCILLLFGISSWELRRWDGFANAVDWFTWKYSSALVFTSTCKLHCVSVFGIISPASQAIAVDTQDRKYGRGNKTVIWRN